MCTDVHFVSIFIYLYFIFIFLCNIFTPKSTIHHGNCLSSWSVIDFNCSFKCSILHIFNSNIFYYLAYLMVSWYFTTRSSCYIFIDMYSGFSCLLPTSMTFQVIQFVTIEPVSYTHLDVYKRQSPMTR